jgi:hypothetical protein
VLGTRRVARRSASLNTPLLHRHATSRLLAYGLLTALHLHLLPLLLAAHRLLLLDLLLAAHAVLLDPVGLLALLLLGLALLLATRGLLADTFRSIRLLPLPVRRLPGMRR